MPEPPILTVKNAVATISINDAPYNRMSLDHMDGLEELLPKLAEDNDVRALVPGCPDHGDRSRHGLGAQAGVLPGCCSTNRTKTRTAGSMPICTSSAA